MAKVYVFSTLACDQRYVDYQKGPNDLPIEGRSVLIEGGTGVANKRLVTPLGVCTTITDADLELLEQNEMFKLHRDKGFLTVQRKSADPEKVASDMSLADPSAPLTPSDYQDGGRFSKEASAPKVGAA
jgi:hypothetical protein